MVNAWSWGPGQSWPLGTLLEWINLSFLLAYDPFIVHMLVSRSCNHNKFELVHRFASESALQRAEVSGAEMTIVDASFLDSDSQSDLAGLDKA